MKFILIFFTFLGLTFGNAVPTKNLQDDLNDFLALIPLDEILAIVMEYLSNDAQVQDAMAYLQSDSFHNIITTLESQTEFKDFIGFLKDHGLDAAEFINEIHAIIGLGPYGGAKSAKPGDGINGLINDIIPICPIDDLKALFQEKLETSPDFKALYDEIRGPEFQTLMATLRALPEYKELLQKLRDDEVDVDHYIDVIRSLFNISEGSPSTKNLKDDLDDFLALLPLDEIMAIALDCLANDSQVQEFVQYLQSDDFHTLVTTIESDPEFQKALITKLQGIPEYAALKEKLNGYGVDINSFIQLIKDLLGIPNASPSTKNLQDDLNDFLALLPLDEILAIALDYLANDAQVQEFVAYLQSDDFHAIVTKIESDPEFQKSVDFLKAHGIDGVIDYVNTFNNFIGLGAYGGAKSTIQQGEGFSGLLNIIIPLIPCDKLQALYQEKLQTSQDFKELVEAIQGPDFQGLIITLKAMPEYIALLDKLRGYGVDVDTFIQLFKDLLGIPNGSPSTKTLKDDLNDPIFPLTPCDILQCDEIVAIVLDYLANDAQVQEFVAYLQSDDFHKIVTTIESDPEFQKCVDFLKAHGIDAVIDYVNTFNNFIGLGPYGGARSPSPGDGVQGLINDIIAILPLDQLKAFYQEKLETSPDFKALVEAIQGPDFQAFISKLKAMPEYTALLDKLRGYGVDVDSFIQLLKDLLGITNGSPSTKNLKNDLDDLLALLPIDDILAIALDYLTNDAQVQEFVAYLQSDDFHKIVTTIESDPEFQASVDFLKAHGIDAVIEYVNTFNTFIGLGPYGGAKSASTGEGISGLINDITAILPLDPLKALCQEKMETSPDFKALYDAIRGPDFQGMLDTLRGMPEYQELLKKLTGYGVDVEHFIGVIRSLFGLE